MNEIERVLDLHCMLKHDGKLEQHIRHNSDQVGLVTKTALKDLALVRTIGQEGREVMILASNIGPKVARSCSGQKNLPLR